jgi:hypothetical protein
MADMIYTVIHNGERIDVRGPAGATTNELRAAAASHKPAAPVRAPGDIPARSNLTAGQTAYGAITNIPSSGVQLAKDIATPFLHPINTVTNLAGLGGGVLAKMGIGDFDETTANAVGEYLANRYGGIEALKHTLAEDPIGLVSDVAGVLMGGSGLAAKAPGILGRTAKVAGAAGRAIDPLTNAAKVTKTAAGTRAGQVALAPLKAAGSMAATAALYPVSLLSGVPVTDIKRATTTNPKFGAAVERHMTGNAPLDEPVTAIKGALKNMYKQRGDDYRAGIGGVTSDPTFLSMKSIRQAVKDAQDMGIYKDVSLNDATAAIWQKVNDKIEEFAKIPGGQGRTVEGLDKLKQAIYNIGANEEFHSPARLVADKARRAVLTEIKRQAPGYAAVMAPYQKMSEAMEDVEKSLSIGDKASKDVALGKLQSMSRNSASSKYGRRAQQMDLLAKYGAGEVPYMLAGQSLGSVEPRGLARLGGEAVTLGSVLNTSFAPLLAATSPRVVGRAARTASKLPGLVAKYGAGTTGPAIASNLGRGSQNVDDQAYQRLMAEYLYPKKMKAPPDIGPYGTLSDDELRSLIRGPQGLEEDSVPDTADTPAQPEPSMAPGPDLQ